MVNSSCILFEFIFNFLLRLIIFQLAVQLFKLKINISQNAHTIYTGKHIRKHMSIKITLYKRLIFLSKGFILSPVLLYLKIYGQGQETHFNCTLPRKRTSTLWTQTNIYNPRVLGLDKLLRGHLINFQLACFNFLLFPKLKAPKAVSK